MNLRTIFIYLAFTLLFLSACKPMSEESGSTKTSREGRAALGTAEDFSIELIKSLDEASLKQSWLLQNQTANRLWADLNRPVKREKADFVVWQTWYTREDLQRIFRRAYQQLGKEGRAERKALSEDLIAQSMAYHDTEQFAEEGWDGASFDRWLSRYVGKENAIPGLNKVLMNREALVVILKNYAAINTCLRNLEGAKPCHELSLAFPKGAAFLKTAWRRGQIDGDFKVPYYQTDDLLAQLSGSEWRSHDSGIPLSTNAYRMETPSHQVFHLVGIHLNTRLDTQWLYSSVWAENNSYRACTSMDFHGLANPLAKGWEKSVADAEAQLGHSWCSSPYLEGGEQNHKTNCVGCHQHAGSAWTEESFTTALTENLSALTQDAKVHSRSDQVWSLLNGPEPLSSIIYQEIDYFDVYDL
ncbi:MAG: hypothetical protein V4655_06930 [Bdellovibrionota bacterium]